MKLQSTFIHLLYFLIFIAVAHAQSARRLVYDGYENPAAQSSGAELKLPLRYERVLRANGGFMLLQEAVTTSSGSLMTRRGILMLARFASSESDAFTSDGMRQWDDSRRMEPKGIPVLLDLFRKNNNSDEAIFDREHFFRNPEMYRMRIGFDADQDTDFSPEEFTEIDLEQTTSGPVDPVHEAAVFRMGSKFAMHRYQTTATLNGLLLPDGNPIHVAIAFEFRPDLAEYYLRDQARSADWSDFFFMMQMEVPLPITARSADPPNEIILLDMRINGDRLKLESFSLPVWVEGEKARYAPQPELPLDAPFRWKGRWHMIRAISRDLSSITLGEPAPGFVPPKTAAAGEPLPEFTRVDIVSRRIVKSLEFKGRPTVITFVEDSEPQTINGMRLMAGKLQEAGGCRVVFVMPWLNMDDYLKAVAGFETLPYELMQDKDSLNDEGQRLSDLFYHERSEPLTLFVNESGEIAIRENRPLYSVLPRFLRMLREDRTQGATELDPAHK